MKRMARSISKGRQLIAYPLGGFLWEVKAVQLLQELFPQVQRQQVRRPQVQRPQVDRLRFRSKRNVLLWEMWESLASPLALRTLIASRVASSSMSRHRQVAPAAMTAAGAAKNLHPNSEVDFLTGFSTDFRFRITDF